MPRSFWLVAAVLLGGWGAPETLPGWPLYDRLCIACHGANGDGHGPAAPFTVGRPRSFQRGVYQWRSTRLGQPPTDEDLRAAISFGAPGSSMPRFGDVLSAEQIDQLIAVVKAFSPDAFGTVGTTVVLGPAPARDPARGAVLFEKLCRACHGTGAGDGPSAFALAIQPYRFDRLPLRRPRASDSAKREAAARSIATGLAGTPMPSFAGKLADDEIWVLADHIVAINARARSDHRTIDAEAIALDINAPLDRGTWPGRGETSPFGGAIDLQGAPPPSLAPAQASLDERQCARCHAKQVREAQSSLHRSAGSPGFVAQTEQGNVDRATCLRCHAPLPEQSSDPSQGVSCAGCHLRGWIRGGPPVISASLLLQPGYPLATATLYERSDFCMPCHQLPPRFAIAGKPLLDTYREWLESPYMLRGMQCQHCHMPNREHAVLGIHDPQTFRQGIELTASAHRTDRAVSVLAALRNVGAGHDLPTTASPLVILRIELFDRAGRAIEGAHDELRIGRDAGGHAAQGDREERDTRIPPGEQATFARAWTAGRTQDATRARITVEVQPDAFYERLYAGKLLGKVAPAQRTLFEQALSKSRGSHYVAETRDLPIN